MPSSDTSSLPPLPTPESIGHPDMAYLVSPAAQARYAMAAHFLKGCPRILEIGGFLTPITGFLTHHPEQVLVIDPKTPALEMSELNGRPCRVEHRPVKFQKVELDWPAGSYGMAIIGLSLKVKEDGAEEMWGRLTDWLDGAAMAIIEYSPDWQRGRDGVDRLLGATRLSVRRRIDLDLSGDPDFDTPYTRRRLLVLAP